MTKITDEVLSRELVEERNRLFKTVKRTFMLAAGVMAGSIVCIALWPDNANAIFASLWTVGALIGMWACRNYGYLQGIDDTVVRIVMRDRPKK